MTSRTIDIAGVVYVRSRDAARACGVSSDYASRLARAGSVAGRLVEGLWFVDPESLRQFLAEQERHKEMMRARLAQIRREEQRRAGHPAAA